MTARRVPSYVVVRAATLALVAIMLASCGGDSSSDAADTTRPTETSVKATTTSEPASSTTEEPTTTVPEWDPASLPGRIAVVSFGCSNDLGSMGGDTSVVCVFDPDGGNLQMVSPPGESASWINWTWDGTKLLFDTEGSAWAVDADGSNLVERDPWAVPGWGLSPDGKWNVGTRWGEPGFFLRTAGTTKATADWRAVTFNWTDCCQVARWSPDSQRLLYTTNVDEACPQIAVTVLDGSPPVAITGPGSPTEGQEVCAVLDEARWSPDGSMVLFIDAGRDFQSSTPMLVDADGRNLRPLVPDLSKLPSGAYIDQVAWSPDGRAVVMSLAHDMGSGLYLVSADGKHLTEIAGLPMLVPMEIAWAPGS